MKARISLVLSLALAAGSALASDDNVATRIIARLMPGITPRAIATRYGITYKDHMMPFALFEAQSEDKVDQVQELMALDPDIVWAEDDDEAESPENSGGGRGGTIPAVAADPILRERNAYALGQVGYPGFGAASPEAFRVVRVAILDNGISQYAKPLTAKTLVWANTRDGGSATDAARGQDSNKDGIKDNAWGHGTMVAGIISQMAPTAKFLNYRVMDSDGRSTAWSITKGLAMAVLQGAEIANLSLGSVGKIAAINDVLDWAVEEKGLIVVAAAGNGNLSDLFSPADNSKVIAVTAILANDKKAAFSNYSSKVKVCAPGVTLKSYHRDGKTAIWSGTSFSAPMTTGGIAYALSTTKKRVAPENVVAGLKATGKLVDAVNGVYKGKLGRKLQVRALADWFKLRGY